MNRPEQKQNKMKNENKKSDAASVALEVVTKKEQAQITEIQELGKGIIVAMGELGEKYLRLILFIRANQVSPKLVSRELTNLGFKRSRVSEINRIAQCGDKLFKQYEAKLIGFNKILDLARTEKGKAPALTPAGALLLEEGKLEETDERAMLKSGEVEDKRKPARQSVKSKLKEAADLILMNGKAGQEWWFKKSPLKLVLVACHPETGATE